MKGIMTKYGPYPGTWPQEPYRPSEPQRSTFIGTNASKKKYIYSDYDYVREDMDIEEYWEDMDAKVPKKPTKGMYDYLSLQDILDLAPPGTEPQNIILDLSYPRYMDYINVSFYVMVRDLEAEEKAYQRAMKQFQHNLDVYQEQYVEYEKHKSAYENWMKQQEVKELEEKLAKLKK